MKIMGGDLSMTASGICLPSGELHTITPSGGDGDRRLTMIRININYLVRETRPDFVVLEEVPNWLRSKRAMVALLMVHGVVREVLAGLYIPFGYVGATALKKYATANGTATKLDMIDAAEESTGARPADDNQADAYWCRAIGEHKFNHRPVDASAALAADMIPAITKDWPDPTATARTRKTRPAG